MSDRSHKKPDKGKINNVPICLPPVTKPIANGRSFGGNQRVIIELKIFQLNLIKQNFVYLVLGCNKASAKPVKIRAPIASQTLIVETNGTATLLIITNVIEITIIHLLLSLSACVPVMSISKEPTF